MFSVKRKHIRSKGGSARGTRHLKVPAGAPNAARGEEDRESPSRLRASNREPASVDGESTDLPPAVSPVHEAEHDSRLNEAEHESRPNEAEHESRLNEAERESGGPSDDDGNVPHAPPPSYDDASAVPPDAGDAAARERTSTNRAAAPSGDIRGVCGKCFQPVYASQERDKDKKGVYYHVRPDECG